MNLIDYCLTEEELWAAQEGTINAARTRHLNHCQDCRRRSKELHDSRLELKRIYSGSSGTNKLPASRKSTYETLKDVPDILNERYQIIQQIDQGGQGVVYLGIDLHLRRQVAIKLSHTTFVDDADSSERILAEGQLLAKINHPLLAQVYDVGIQAGRPYLVMEFVNGATLQTVLRTKQLKRNQVVRVISLIAQGVAVIHESGILHLDLKPENIILTQEGSCKIVDLGTSWLESNQTQQYLGGTTGYMAPEQAAGESDSIGPWTDVYGLGTILAAMLLPIVSDVPAEGAQIFNEKTAWKGCFKNSRNLLNSLLGQLCIDATKPCHHERIATIRLFQKRLARFERYRQYSLTVFFCGLLMMIAGPPWLTSFKKANPTTILPSDRADASQRIEKTPQKLSILEPRKSTTKPHYIQFAIYGLTERDYYFGVWVNTADLRLFPSKWVIKKDGTEFLTIDSHPEELESSHRSEDLRILLIPGNYPGMRQSEIKTELARTLFNSHDFQQIENQEHPQIFLVRPHSRDEGQSGAEQLSYRTSRQNFRVQWHSYGK